MTLTRLTFGPMIQHGKTTVTHLVLPCECKLELPEPVDSYWGDTLVVDVETSAEHPSGAHHHEIANAERQAAPIWN